MAARTIDITPTWRGIMPVLIEGIRHGTPEGQRIAREELMRLADIADREIARDRVFSRNAQREIAAHIASGPDGWRTEFPCQEG